MLEDGAPPHAGQRLSVLAGVSQEELLARLDRIHSLQGVRSRQFVNTMC